MKNKTRTIWTILVVGVLGLGVLGYAAANTLTGREIIENVDAMETADDAMLLMTMTLINDRDESLVREMRSWKQGTETTALVFIAPEDVTGTAFLTIDIDGDDDMWLYLPSLDLVKRIAGGDKRTSFAGTDFFYEDISGRSIYDDKHVLEETTEAYYVLKNTPEDADIVEFSYYITKIDKKTYLPMVVEFYDKQGELYRIYEVQEVQIFQDIPTITRAVMKDLKTGSETSAEFSRVKYNIGLEDNIFTERYLRRAPRKWIKARYWWVDQEFGGFCDSFAPA